jgi:putative ABC transport system permease protein
MTPTRSSRDRQRPFWYLRRRRAQLQADVDEELRVHLEMRTDELVRQGMSREAAAGEARRQFGDLDYTRRYCLEQGTRKETRMSRRLDFSELHQDLRYSVRAFARKPGFALVAILTLALGIGANTAIFSLINGVLMRPVATPNPERLVVIREDLPGLNLLDTPLSPPEILDLSARTDLFTNVTGYQPFAWNLSGSDGGVRVEGAVTVGDFFEVFAVRPYLGTLYTSEHSRNGQHQVVVFSYGAWQTYAGGDPRIIGQTVQLDGVPRVVVGVLPPSFQYPRNAQVYKPANLPPQALRMRGTLSMTAVARLRDRVTLTQLASQLGTEATRWNEQYGGGKALFARPFAEYHAGRLRRVLFVLMGAVVMVLMIACANVGNLQLVRTVSRARELAVRSALGAGKGRILRQLLVESGVLALVGGGLGLSLGALLLRALVRWDASQVIGVGAVRLDGRVLGFTALVSILAALAFGTLPALRAMRTDLQRTLRDEGRGTMGSIGRARLLRGSVVVQIALALVLLTGAGLLIRSLDRLLDSDIGFVSADLVAAQVALPGVKYDSVSKQSAFYATVLERLRTMPGVTAASIAWALPFSTQTGDSNPLEIVGRAPRPGDPAMHAEYRVVDGDYFRTMGIPLLRGRTFEPSDDMTSAAGTVIVIDDLLARQFFPGEDPIGRRIRHGRGEGTVIGVVGSISQRQVDEPRQKAVSYYHFRQTRSVLMAIVVRSARDLGAVAQMIRASVHESDPELPVYDIATMEKRVDSSLGDRRLAVAALAGFAGLSVLLAVLGLYAVLSHTTERRKPEMGVRMAVGASPGQVLRLVMRDGLLLSSLGILFGLAAAVILTRLMEGMLFGVGARDPLTLVVSTALIAGVTVLGTTLPAWRAARVNPLTAMRSE